MYIIAWAYKCWIIICGWKESGRILILVTILVSKVEYTIQCCQMYGSLGCDALLNIFSRILRPRYAPTPIKGRGIYILMFFFHQLWKIFCLFSLILGKFYIFYYYAPFTPPWTSKLRSFELILRISFVATLHTYS